MYYGDIVKKYLKTCYVDTVYNVYTINDNLEVIKVMGMIRNNGSWNYHNNYNDSSNELQIINENGSYTPKWFTFYEKEAIKIQKELISEWKQLLDAELLRLESIKIKKII